MNETNDSIQLDNLICKSGASLTTPDIMNSTTFCSAGGEVMRITSEGRLEKGAGLSDDAASLLFFDACQKVFSNAADELRDLRAEVVRLQSARYKYEDDPEMVFDEDLGWVHVIVQKEFRDLRAELADTKEESERMRQEALYFGNKAEELQAQCAEREIELSRYLENEFAVKLAAERADKIKWAKALLVSVESLADDNPDHWASEESRRRYAALTIATLREEIGQLEGKIK